MIGQIARREGDVSVPATWCVVVCELGCLETWVVDTTDFTPRLTPAEVVRLLRPLLSTHELSHW